MKKFNLAKALKGKKVITREGIPYIIEGVIKVAGGYFQLHGYLMYEDYNVSFQCHVSGKRFDTIQSDYDLFME